MKGELVVCADPDALAHRVAEWLIDRIGEHPGIVRIALCGGSSPKPLYQLLATEEYSNHIPWRRVHLFWGDERFVPHDDPKSNYGMARDLFISKVPLPDANVHPIPTDGTPEDAAARYERLLQAEYGATAFDPARPLFDVNFLGLGDNGHIASLMPGEPVLEERHRWVAPLLHGAPEPRITLTYPALESSRYVAFQVTGANKAGVLKAVRSGQSDLPAARLAPHGALIWFADRAAADEAVEAEPAYVRFSDDPVAYTVALEEGSVIADYDTNGAVRGIEFITVRKHPVEYYHELAERMSKGPKRGVQRPKPALK